MKILVAISGSASGDENMRRDLELLDQCDGQTAYFRFYRWSPYCVSLGANQGEEILNLDALKEKGWDYVKRPTGGRAILHAEEITYAAAFPLIESFTPMVIYKGIHLALLQGLTRFHSSLAMVDFEHHQPDFLSFYKTAPGAACFASTARSELTYEGRKLVGSAQKKSGSKILQHGSILCAETHRNLTEVLSCGDDEKAVISGELQKRTATIYDITGTLPDYEALTNALVSGVSDYFIEAGYSAALA